MAAFDADNYGSGDTTTTLDIDATNVINPNIENVYFVVPFTYGTSFKLGIWADAHASEIASGGSVVPNTSSFELSNTISWNGKGYEMTDTSNPATQTTSFGINSTSGFDYTNAYAPGTVYNRTGSGRLRAVDQASRSAVNERCKPLACARGSVIPCKARVRCRATTAREWCLRVSWNEVPGPRRANV